MFERIDTICLTVSNVEQSSAWYRELCFKIAFRDESYGVLTVGNSEVPLTIEEGNVTKKENNTYPIFFTKDIKNTYRNLQEKDLEVTELQNVGDNTFFDFST